MRRAEEAARACRPTARPAGLRRRAPGPRRSVRKSGRRGRAAGACPWRCAGPGAGRRAARPGAGCPGGPVAGRNRGPAADPGTGSREKTTGESTAAPRWRTRAAPGAGPRALSRWAYAAHRRLPPTRDGFPRDAQPCAEPAAAWKRLQPPVRPPDAVTRGGLRCGALERGASMRAGPRLPGAPWWRGRRPWFPRGRRRSARPGPRPARSPGRPSGAHRAARTAGQRRRAAARRAEVSAGPAGQAGSAGLAAREERRDRLGSRWPSRRLRRTARERTAYGSLPRPDRAAPRTPTTVR